MVSVFNIKIIILGLGGNKKPSVNGWYDEKVERRIYDILYIFRAKESLDHFLFPQMQFLKPFMLSGAWRAWHLTDYEARKKIGT